MDFLEFQVEVLCQEFQVSGLRYHMNRQRGDWWVAAVDPETRACHPEPA